MMSIRFQKLSLKIIVLLIAVDAIFFVTLLSIKKLSSVVTGCGINPISFTAIWELTQLMIHSPYLWLGIASGIFSFILWMTVLSSIDLSIAFPLGSLSYFVIPVFSMIFLHEKIPPLRWAGIIFIISGILILSINDKKTMNHS